MEEEGEREGRKKGGGGGGAELILCLCFPINPHGAAVVPGAASSSLGHPGC